MELPRIAFWGAAQAFGFRLDPDGAFHRADFGDLTRGAWVGTWRNVAVLARGDYRVAARMNPPLLLGVRPGPRGRIRGFDDRAMLVAREVRRVLRNQAARRGIEVHDRAVVQHLPPSAADPAPDVALMLNTVTSLALSLGELSASLPRTSGERARDAAWSAVAARHGLAHDVARARVEGVYAGVAITIELASGEATFRTRATVGGVGGVDGEERWYERPLETIDDLEQALDDCARAAVAVAGRA